MGRECLVEETCCSVKQDSFRTKEEVGIGVEGILITVELVLSDNTRREYIVENIGLITTDVCEVDNLLKEGVVEGMIVAREKEIGACERSISFKFLISCQ